MRDLDTNLFLALSGAPDVGIIPRRLVHMTAKSFSTGETTTAAFWSGDGEETLVVESVDNDSAVSRIYHGGVNLITGSIPLVSDLTIQTISVTLNVLDEKVEEFVRGSDLRLGKIEIHDVLYDTTTRNPVAVAPLVFFGEIDGSPIETGSAGGESQVTIRASSDVILMLTRINPAKSSYQEQKLRDGDDWGKHSAAITTWQINWGQD